MKPAYDRDGITIYHADCRDILPTLDPAGVALVVTDPPYGVAWDTDYTRFTKGADVSGVFKRIANDADPFDPTPLLSFPRAILFGANAFSDRLPLGSWLVWDKRSPGGAKNVLSDGEVAWYSEGHGVYLYSHTWDGFNRASERGEPRVHPTQKPVALMAWILERYTKPGDLVLDPYMGSGPVAKAAQTLGRRYIGIELVREYVDAAINRLAQEPLFTPSSEVGVAPA